MPHSRRPEATPQARAAAGVLGLALVLFLFSCEKGDAPERNGPAPRVEPPRKGRGAPLPPDDLPKGGVAWLEDARAWEVAAAPLRLLYLRAPRELGCALTEGVSFTDPGVLEWLKAQAACRWSAFIGSEDLARRYGVGDAPALVFLDRAGGFVGAIVGYRPPYRLLAELKPMPGRAAELLERARALEETLQKAKGAERIDALDSAAELAAERRLYARAETCLVELLAQPGVGETRALATLHLRHGQALEGLGRRAEAARAFERAQAADQLQIYGEELAYRRAENRTLAGEYAGAAGLWAAFGQEFPRSERAESAAYHQAYCLLRGGRQEEAVRVVGGNLARMRQLVESAERRIEAAQGILQSGAGDAETSNAAAQMLVASERQKKRALAAELGLRTLLFSLSDADAALRVLPVDEARRTALADALADGRDLVRKYSCYDCHQLIESGVKPPFKTCVQCHNEIQGLALNAERHDELLRAKPHFFRSCARIRHGLRAPNLFGAGARLRPEWLRKFLENPYDVRPHLEESMLQMNLERPELEALVRYFQAIATTAGKKPPEEGEADPPPAAAAGALAAEGRELFVRQKCHVCHQFGNVRFGPDQGGFQWEGGRAEAPNLRYVRERLLRRTAAEWIRDPAAVSPGTRMPKFELSDGEIAALVEFLFTGDPGEPFTVAEKSLALPTVAHTPAWEEVNLSIFQDTCIHCHMSDQDGGAGNVGGYGFRARRLDLSTYAGVRRGSLQPDGTRLDILKPRDGGLPPMLAARVWRRMEENKRDKIEPFQDPLAELAAPRKARVAPGMPYGHPALTPEQLALLEAWLAAGAPGPKPQPMADPEIKRIGD